MNRPGSIWSRRRRRQVGAVLVLVAYLFATLGVPVALAIPGQAAATPSTAEKAAASHACCCDPMATCCCTPQPACSQPCCAPPKEAPRAPGLSLSPLSCRCTTSNVWISMGSVLPAPAAAEWQPHFIPLDWIGDIEPGLVVVARLPDVPPPRITF